MSTSSMNMRVAIPLFVSRVRGFSLFHLLVHSATYEPVWRVRLPPSPSQLVYKAIHFR